MVCKAALASRKKGKFTPDEDEIILKFVMEKGRLWVDLAKKLGRDALTVRNHHEIVRLDIPHDEVLNMTDKKKSSESSASISESKPASYVMQSQDSLGFIVLDSSKFSAGGQHKVWDWYNSRGHEVLIFLPQSRIMKVS